MRALITGIAGFAGSHLTELLLTEKNIEIYGIDHPKAGIKNIYYIRKKIRFEECDITKPGQLKRVLKKMRPHIIFHLAAQSNPSLSFKAPVGTINTNIIGEINLFEALRQLRQHPRVLIFGSSDEYGLVEKNELPVKETQALRPRNIYAVTKTAQDLLGYQYHKNFSFSVVRVRPFHHTGPRQNESFVCSNFAKQVALIEMGRKRPILNVGNVKVKRDFTDVRDMVRGYWLLAQDGIPGEVYNICSGKAISIKDIVGIFLSLADIKIKIKQEKSRMRTQDIPVLVGDFTRLNRLTGWKPTIPLKKTLEDLLNYWRMEL